MKVVLVVGPCQRLGGARSTAEDAVQRPTGPQLLSQGADAGAVGEPVVGALLERDAGAGQGLHDGPGLGAGAVEHGEVVERQAVRAVAGHAAGVE